MPGDGTRPAPDTVGTRAAALTATEVYSIPVLGVNGNCMIPADAVGLSLNVTIDNPTGDSYLTVYPADASRPTASNLNWSAGQAPVPNAVTTDVSADGRITFYNNAGTVDVLVDIVGYYADHNHDDRYFTKAETLSAEEITDELDGKLDVPGGAGSLWVAATSMTPGEGSFDYGVNPGTGRLNMLDAGCFHSDALELPDGVTVTAMVANVYDPNPSVAEVRLYTNGIGSTPWEVMIEMASAGTSGEQLLVSSTVAFPVVDRDLFLYQIVACGDAAIGFHDFRIDFTYP